MIFQRFRVIPTLTVISLALTLGCSKDDDKSSPPLNAGIALPVAGLSLTSTVLSDQRFSTLNAALERADLLTVLDSGEFTVFAPTNEAFAKIPAAGLDALLNDKNALTQVLLNHVLVGSLRAEKVLAQKSLKSANDFVIQVSQTSEGAFVNNAKIVATDVIANNGVIHAIDSVLLASESEQKPALNLVDLVVADQNFSTLKAALVAADLVEVLRQGEFTVFAPNNAAFAKIPQETLAALLADKAALTKILLYHVVSGTLKAPDVLAQTTLSSANQLPLTVSQTAEGAFINASKLIATDILASNGVIHVIDTVLLPTTPDQKPTPNLVDLVLADENFSTLKAALVAADLVDVLRQGEFTVFAPTNAAFAKIPKETLEALLADKEGLTRVLLYHVVGGSLKAQDVLAQSKLTSANQLELSISQNSEGAFVNSSKIIATDIIASNGVIHAIDSVLLP